VRAQDESNFFLATQSLVPRDPNFAIFSHVTTFGVGCTLNTAGCHLNFAKISLD